ncbi:MAG: hypothetical protein ACOZCK_09290 [Pseudomonadota bacterium]|jgi:hypothetical protein
MNELAEFDNKLLNGLDFCERADALLKAMHKQAEGRSALRRRKRGPKKLVEELIPICKYIEKHYSCSRKIEVRWKDGNQKYDAAIIQTGFDVDRGLYPNEAFIEVTCVEHPKAYLQRELIDTEGWSFSVESLKRGEDRTIESVPTCRSGLAFVDDFSQMVIDRIREKEDKSYPKNTYLIVCCHTQTGYHEYEWERLENQVRNNLSSSRFEEIFVYDSLCGFSFSLP